MSTLVLELRNEIRRLARKELKAELTSTKKAVSQHRREIAELKRKNNQLEETVQFLKQREQKRLKHSSPQPTNGSRFSARSLKSQRKRTGLSQADYSLLAGVSPMTIYNWENGKSKPGEERLAKLVSLRGLGKRAAEKRLDLLEG